ncbi:hypothetical protein EM6_1633 [Asticcacaulis excentricus]|uniref:Fatty acid hydroxylase domain-containing protein n=2 Tax=Asticcacaulis excentricus TaxID=78587 RepID=A0A3G9G9I9_9CAUL|nr:hypothetical protein EM6_1633 [Asticcacaulis excentricus]
MICAIKSKTGETGMLLLGVIAITGLLFVLIFTREVIAPASGARCDRRWRILAGSLNAASLLAVVAVGVVFDRLISQWSLFDLKAQVDPLSGGFIAFLVSSFLAYWWHRATHISDTLWRFVHQLHHAPRRIEALTAFYLHPVDAFMAALLNAVVAYGVLGVSGLSLAFSLILVSVFDLVAHADQRTPHWLGYITQRPEMHRVHHQYGHHKQNYGLPLWDMLFGTFANPQAGPERCGFDDKRAAQIKDMLLFRDVHKGR